MANLKGGTTIGGYRAVHTKNIMTILKARDGHSSGLDADLLDSKEAELFIYGENNTGTRNADNIDWIKKSGFYRPASITNKEGTTLPENTHSSLLHIAHPTMENYFSQIAITYDRNDIYFRNKNYMGLSKWHKIYHEDFKPTPTDIGAWSRTAIRLQGADFNTVTSGGIYSTVNNSTEKNAPVNYDGRLIVLSWNQGSWASQMFFADGGAIYSRTAKNLQGTDWTRWTELYTRQSRPTPEEIGALRKTEKAVDSDKLKGFSLCDSNSNYIGITLVDSQGTMEVGKYIDFHLPGEKKDFNARLEAMENGMICSTTGFIGNDISINKFLRVKDWYGSSQEGRLWFKGESKALITENVSIIQTEKFQALSGGITSNGQIYAYKTDIKADKNVICGGKFESTITSGGADLYAEGRGASTHGWHFADMDGHYSDIYAATYRQQSDARTKEEIPKKLLKESEESILQKISKIDTKEYFYLKDPDKKPIHGFFAQDLEKEFPLIVTTSKYSEEEMKNSNIILPKDKYGNKIYDLKTVDPIAICATMWDALKEVHKSLEIQKSLNKELLDKIKQLEDKNK